MSQHETKIYGVSFGNGNDGVSQTWPDYYVKTSDPWSLARLAVIAGFKPCAQRWAAESVMVDGEEEYTISACLYEPPADTADGFPAESDEDEDGMSYCDANGAWRICEAFPADDLDPEEIAAISASPAFCTVKGRPAYGSIVDAIGAKSVIAWGMSDF